MKRRTQGGKQMKISALTIFLIVITIIALTTYIWNGRVTDISHNAADKFYEMYMEHNGSQEGSQILEDGYDGMKILELNQKNNTSISYNRFMIFLIFTLFSYKFDRWNK